MRTCRPAIAFLVLVGVTAIIPSAWADPITITALYPNTVQRDRPMDVQAQTHYIYFQALETVDLVEIIVYGEPYNYIQGAADYRWQFFRTTP